MATTTRDIAEMLGGELQGPGDLRIAGVERLDRAGPNHLTFIGDEQYARRWTESSAGAVLVARNLRVEPGDGRAAIYVDDADLAMAKVLEHFAPDPPRPAPGIHDTAVVDPDALIGDDCRIGPGCVIGPGARLGERCVLHAGAAVMDDAEVGDDGVLWPGVVIRERCVIGRRCVLHANVVIGADGFGYRPNPNGRGVIKIPHIGIVRIGDDVELGAATCVDRAKFSATEIGDGSKLDNLVQVGHNCRIGRSVVIAGHVAVAGSVTIGDGAMIGGMVAVADHLTIGPGARLAGGAQLMRDLPAGEKWGSIPARPLKSALREALAIQKLPDAMKEWKRADRSRNPEPPSAKSESSPPSE